MSSDNLVGKNITVYLDGGWEVTGLVAGQESDKIIIDKKGELFLIFRDKVSLLRINRDGNSRFASIGEVSTKPYSRESDDEVEYDEVKYDDGFQYEDDDFSEEDFIKKMEALFPENGISYSETFMNLPRSLLNKGDNRDDDDLSISFKDNKSNNLKFKVEDDT